MGDMSSEGSHLSAGIDLSQFHSVFFDEAGENLEQLEHMLLGLDPACANDETLNAIFRCAHSVKGGAAAFGFADVAELTHRMETLLDRLRRHELAPTAAMVDLLLQAGDALKAQLARHRGAGGAPVDPASLLASIAAAARPPSAAADEAAAVAPAAAAAAAAAAKAPAPATAAPAGARELELTVGPLQDLSQADDLAELFKEIADLGTIEPLDGGCADRGMRRFKLITSCADDELLDLFTFHVDRQQLRLAPFGGGHGLTDGAAAVPAAADAPPTGSRGTDPGFGFFDGAPGAPDADAPAAAAAPRQSAPVSARRATPSPDSATLRVSVEKVDQLINLVGELVITQAMLAQNGQDIDTARQPQLAAGLADLQRHTRDLQQAVMSIRMIPMSLIFNRFPRMLRDLAGKLGKRVELVTRGEATELDKGLIERITDPLTHLVRNSCDHGIEAPAERIARGKAAQGTITLVASHQGGSIVIEVRDDGRGLNRARLLAKARERGIDASDAMSDAEVWALVFAPGFSTVDEVTDVSGRGVGMDVVKKTITTLGGSVEIDSAEGYGMSVRVRLPLTLAIMDGMSVRVGPECYILPLSSVVESIQVQPGTIRTIGGQDRVVAVREAYLPVLDLERVFSVPRADAEAASPLLVVVEAEGVRIALLVHELLGQQQVVVKNLEANYRKVDDISGATILGDGRVALILDVGSLVRRSRH